MDEELPTLPRALAARYDVTEELDSAGAEANLLKVVDERGIPRVVKIYRRRGEQASRDVWRSLERLSSSHIVQVVDTGQAAGHDFEVMEYAAGGNLLDLAGPDGVRAEAPFVRGVVRQIAEGLKSLHNEGIVHQDLKPENVLVRKKSPLDLVLADFGISRLLHQTRVAAEAAGTLAYLAPELLVRSGGQTSPARDWWALGMITRELLLGERPFKDMVSQSIEAAVTRRPIDLSGVGDPRMELLCRGLLTRDPEARWEWAEVDQWLDGGSPRADDVPLDLATELRQESGSERRPLLLLSQRYTEKEALVGALTQQEAWLAACRRYFTTMGTDEHPSEGWRRLRKWLRQFDEDDQDESLQYLIDEELVDPTAGPDARLIRLIRWLDPDAPAMFRGRSIDPVNLAAAADDARAARVADDDRLLLIEALWQQKLLPEIAGLPSGRGLEQVDRAWRAAYDRYRVAEQWIRQALGPTFRDPPAAALVREILVPLLSLTLEADKESARLRGQLADVAAKTTAVSWYNTARNATGDDPAAILAVLHLAPGALADADYLRRTAEADRKAQLDRAATWTAMESQRRSGSALLGARTSATIPFVLYAVGMVALAILSASAVPDLRQQVVPSLVVGLLLAAGQLVLELKLATEIGGPYRDGYKLFSRSGGGLQAFGSRLNSPGSGCGFLLVAFIVVPFLLATPIILYVVLAIVHVRSVLGRRRDWRSRYAVDRRRVTGVL